MFYRGKEGQWSWIMHRVSGVGVLVFLLAHILDTASIGWGPEVYNAVLKIFQHPVAKVGEIALIAGVLYHALNGVRVILIDFWRQGTKYQRQLFWIEMAVFTALFVPSAFVMLKHMFASE